MFLSAPSVWNIFFNFFLTFIMLKLLKIRVQSFYRKFPHFHLPDWIWVMNSGSNIREVVLCFSSTLFSGLDLILTRYWCCFPLLPTYSWGLSLCPLLQSWTSALQHSALNHCCVWGVPALQGSQKQPLRELILYSLDFMTRASYPHPSTLLSFSLSSSKQPCLLLQRENLRHQSWTLDSVSHSRVQAWLVMLVKLVGLLTSLTSVRCWALKSSDSLPNSEPCQPRPPPSSLWQGCVSPRDYLDWILSVFPALPVSHATITVGNTSDVCDGSKHSEIAHWWWAEWLLVQVCDGEKLSVEDGSLAPISTHLQQIKAV